MGKKGKKGNRNPDDPKPENTQNQDKPSGSGGNQPPPPQQQQQQQKENSKASNSDKEHTKPNQSRKQEGGQQQQGQKQFQPKQTEGSDRSRDGAQQGGGGQHQKPTQAQQREGGDGSRGGQKQDQQQQQRSHGQKQQGGDRDQSKSQQPQQGGKKKGHQTLRQQQGQNQQLEGAGDQKSGGQHPQGAWSGKQQEHQSPQQQQQRQNQPPRGPKDEGRPQQSGGQQPQGAWGSKQQEDQRLRQQQGQNQPNRGPRDEGRPQQSGGQQSPSAWGGKQQEDQRLRQQQGQNQPPRGPRDEGRPQQSGGQQPQGAWGGKQQGYQRPQQQEGQSQTPRGPRDEGRPQQSGGQQPQGAWGSKQQEDQRLRQQQGQNQPPRGPRDEGRPQQSGGQQPQGAWGGKQQGYQRPQQQEGQSQTPRGPRDEGRPQGTPRRGPYQQRQQGDQYQQQQRSPQYDQGKPEPVPEFKAISCAGIKRGTMGTRDVIETNYFTMDLKNMPDIAYHYDVAIEPDRPKKFMRIVFNQCQRQHFPQYAMAYDGSKSCYTVQRLPDSPYNFKIEVADGVSRTKEFTIKIKETDVVEVELRSLKTYHHERVFDKPMRALQTLEVVLASSYHDSGLRVGRSFFRKPSHNMYDLEDGYEMYTGIYQAAILGEEPLLNIDISHKSFPKAQSLLDYLKEIRVYDLTKNLDDKVARHVTTYLKGLNILYKPPDCFGASQRSYKVMSVGESANRLLFTTDEGKRMSVTEYFLNRGYKLQYPNLNCVQVGSSARSIALPMELCFVVEYQSLMRKDNARQVSKMITHSATSTSDRKHKIMELLRVFQGKESLIIRDFGVRLGQNFIKVQMRVLQPPLIQYFNNNMVVPSRGSWQINTGWKYLETSKPATPQGHKWAIIHDKGSRGLHINAIYDFKNSIYKTAQEMSINLAHDCLVDGFNNIDAALRGLAKEKYALVIVILPAYGTSYATVKQNAELKWGVLTQCIKEKTVQRSPRDMSVCTNLLLKLNAKLNGTNHKIGVDQEVELRQLLKPLNNVMFLGADVTHPSPDQRQIPSVVGVAASHDAYGACYNMQYRLQRPTLEDIDDMEGITEHHLRVYKKYQNRYPDYIIYYRDGVSDGQFPIIKRKELRGIRVACKKLNCNAKLTCLIVVKRHHTRFFPIRAPTPRNKFNNVEPGTVVDQRIVHPNEVQFFMVSHQAVQGTAKPTRYNVIEDDAKFNIDFLQKLSYNLCHMFPRCNRSVSYPAPAYLAHLVAFRGRVYLEGTNRFDRLDDEYKKRLVSTNIMENNPMYFV